VKPLGQPPRIAAAHERDRELLLRRPVERAPDLPELVGMNEEAALAAQDREQRLEPEVRVVGAAGGLGPGVGPGGGERLGDEPHAGLVLLAQFLRGGDRGAAAAAGGPGRPRRPPAAGAGQ